MFTGIIQFFELIYNHRLHPFLIFFILCWSIFSYRIFSAQKNKKYENHPIDATTSAIVITYHDNLDILKKSLQSLKKQLIPFSEIIIASDVRENLENKKIFKEYQDKYGFKVIYDNIGNKRTAFGKAFKLSTGNIIYMLAGDTIYPSNTTEETLKPFINPKVGATTIKQRIYDRNKNIARRFADIMYNIRYLITYNGMSSKGIVVCTTGEIGAFRRSIIESHLDEFINETFLGKKCILGDDRFITSMVLKDGYDVVLQPTESVVLTDCPNTLKKLVIQQLRWFRSGQKYTIKTLFRNWIPNKPTMLKIHCFNLLVMPYLFMSVVVWGIFNIIYKFYPILITKNLISTNISIFILIFGFLIAMSIKTYIHLKNNKQDYIYFPIYAIFVVFILLPTYLYALLTIRNQGSWLTK